MGGVVALNLADLPVLMALAGDLGLVGNTQYLRVAAQLAQQAPDNFGDTAADAHVDFIEDQAGHGEVAGADHLDGQADPRQFTAGGHLAQRFQGLAGIGGEQEFDVLEPVGAGVAFAQARFQYGRFHAQCGELFLDLLGE